LIFSSKFISKMVAKWYTIFTKLILVTKLYSITYTFRFYKKNIEPDVIHDYGYYVLPTHFLIKYNQLHQYPSCIQTQIFRFPYLTLLFILLTFIQYSLKLFMYLKNNSNLPSKKKIKYLIITLIYPNQS
jgi:hypothetical protein